MLVRNVVYFDPTSGDVKVINDSMIGLLKTTEMGEPAVVHRVGDLNGMVTVGINLLFSDNMVLVPTTRPITVYGCRDQT